MPDDELDRVPGAIALSEERVEGPARHPESTTQTDAAVLYECSAPGGIGVLQSARAKLAEEGAVTRARQAFTTSSRGPGGNDEAHTDFRICGG